MLPIRLRLTLIFSALLFLALALSGGAVVTILRTRLNMRLDETLDRRLQGVENFLIRETTAATIDKIPVELAEYASTQPEGHLIEVKDRKGNVILASDRTPYRSRSRTRMFAIYENPTGRRHRRPLNQWKNRLKKFEFSYCGRHHYCWHSLDSADTGSAADLCGQLTK